MLVFRLRKIRSVFTLGLILVGLGGGVLRAQTSGTTGSSASFAPTKDELTAIAVYRAFYYDPRIVSAYTDVNVTNGVATLTGTVPNDEARQVAEDIALKTPGVTQVVNRLEVVLPQPAHPDDEIYRNVRHAIETDPQVKRYDVKVGVLNGTVYLAGPVDTVFARAKIANLAGAVPGVVQVANALTVPEGTHLYNHDQLAGGVYPDRESVKPAKRQNEFPQPVAMNPPTESTATAP